MSINFISDIIKNSQFSLDRNSLIINASKFYPDNKISKIPKSFKTKKNFRFFDLENQIFYN